MVVSAPCCNNVTATTLCPLKKKIPTSEFFKQISRNVIYPEDLVYYQGLVVQKVDNSIHRINHYPVDSVLCFVNINIMYWIVIYPVDSDIHLLNNRAQENRRAVQEKEL